MDFIQVDRNKCISCGACSYVCPRGIIYMDGEWPVSQDESFCIACGHCVAACPNEALNNIKTPLKNQLPVSHPILEAEKAYHFLRSRRSIRHFTKEPVGRGKLLQLLDIARFAPTGSNGQGVSYVVIQDRDTLAKISVATVDWMEGQIKSDPELAKRYSGYVRIFRETGRDIVLRDAPCLVVATAPKNIGRGWENTRYSLSYVELYAPSLGLGTCWMGFFEQCARSGYSPLLELLHLPEGKEVTGGIVVGYPVFRYYRLVDRNPLDITFA
jgi:nitroreductase/NAD-dependent dihydropyrimidine dehydrogenase PreA subunit